jgi:2-amino-4-hydroxy-6-hydroxymethyldihydropteridine diphosphokinase
VNASTATGEDVILALGANLGDPLSQLRDAATRLHAELGGCVRSSVYRTEPEGGADQPTYLNAVVRGRWSGSAQELLSLAKELEAAAGRSRPYAGAARTLDVDVLFFGDIVLEEAELHIPHPRWQHRSFVVVPLLDVAPEWVDPKTGRSVADIARRAGWATSDLDVVARPDELLALETI